MGAFTILMAISVHRAQKNVHPGIGLYNASRYDEAALALQAAAETKELKENGEMWNYLELAYMGKDDKKNAIKSFEIAAKLVPAKGAYQANLAKFAIY
jgi:Flp pilus assembly protein TadD